MTPVTDLTLRDYIQARAMYCELQHCKKHCICKPMIQAALIIIEKVFTLSHLCIELYFQTRLINLNMQNENFCKCHWSISNCISKSLGLSFKCARHHFGFNRIAQRIARMDKCINEIQTIHECADRVIVIKEASHLKSLGCTGNSDNTGDRGHGGSNGVMDAPLLRSLGCTGNSDSTGDGGHGGSNGVMDAPLLRSLGCTRNSDSTDDGGHGGSNGVMDAPLLRSLGCTGNSDSTGDGGHDGSNGVMDTTLLR